MARRRLRWQTHQSRIDPRRLVFIDETWAKTNMAPLRGWCARGRRLIAKVPHGHWQTLTFVAVWKKAGAGAVVLEAQEVPEAWGLTPLEPGPEP